MEKTEAQRLVIEIGILEDILERFNEVNPHHGATMNDDISQYLGGTELINYQNSRRAIWPDKY